MSGYWIQKVPYWIEPAGIEKVEALKNAVFMGAFCTQRPGGGWNESPVDVFYVANPDREKGHTNYFGLFYRDNILLICDASSAFSEPMTGVLGPEYEVVVSRYRHDYQTRDNGAMIDGGRDYVRCNAAHQPLISVTVDGPEFIFHATA